MRYIDADKLQQAYKEIHGGKRSLLIDTEPTADVVEVVRCKDCKYDHKCSHNIIRPSKGGGIIYCPLEYCSEGERAES